MPAPGFCRRLPAKQYRVDLPQAFHKETGIKFAQLSLYFTGFSKGNQPLPAASCDAVAASYAKMGKTVFSFAKNGTREIPPDKLWRNFPLSHIP